MEISGQGYSEDTLDDDWCVRYVGNPRSEENIPNPDFIIPVRESKGIYLWRSPNESRIH